MIERVFASLEAAAERLAAARFAEGALARRERAWRWRSARLLWPLFTKGPS